ncbi:hypothetical protein K2X83_02235 [Patescibacteria group bacterium]|nr:hypothetical protein [Patescibacteria group bacterium]
MKKTSSALKLFLCLVAFVGVFFPGTADAISISGAAGAAGGLLTQPYGGQVKGFPIVCTCPKDYGKFLITLGPPSPGTYVVDMKKVVLKPYLNMMWIVPGVWHRGMRKPVLPTACNQVVPNGCVPSIPPAMFEVEFAGTSLPGI